MPDRTVRTLYAKTEPEMDKKLAELRAEIEAGVDARNNPTFAQYVATWFPARTAELSPAREQDYRSAINNHIGPFIAWKKMKDVTAQDGRDIMLALAGKSNSLQANVVCTLKGIFSDAEEEGLIIRSPFRKLKAGGKKAKEKQPLSDDQAEQLLAAVKGTVAEPFVMLGLYAGLRREEILGLKWDAVRLHGVPFLEVRKAVAFSPQNGAPELKDELKSKAARRKIPLPPRLLEFLRSWRIQNPHDFVVPNSDGGPRSKQSFRRLWEIVEVRSAGTYKRYDKKTKKYVEVQREIGEKVPKHNIVVSLDFRCTPHQLRHTYITNLCRARVPIKTVQYLAGHATVQMTLNVYVHVTENQPEDLQEMISQAFSGEQKDTKTGTKRENSDISAIIDNF